MKALLKNQFDITRKHLKPTANMRQGILEMYKLMKMVIVEIEKKESNMDKSYKKLIKKEKSLEKDTKKVLKKDAGRDKMVEKAKKMKKGC
jgi:hypothetical protein